MGVTGLLPIILLPTLGLVRGRSVSSSYFSDEIVICWASLIMAMAVDQYSLHSKFAQYLLAKTSSAGLPGLILAFVMTTGFISMWLSNTATAALMAPLSKAVFSELTRSSKYREDKIRAAASAVDLGIAYASSLGGMATLTGTGANLVVAGTMLAVFGEEGQLSFGTWLMMMCPLAIINLFLLWVILMIAFMIPFTEVLTYCAGALRIGDALATRERRHDTSRTSSNTEVDASQGYHDRAPNALAVVPLERPDLSDERKNINNIHVLHTVAVNRLAVDEKPYKNNLNATTSSSSLGFAEWVVLLTFIAMAVLWITRDPPNHRGWAKLFSEPDFISDGTVALGCCVFLFVCPKAPSPAAVTVWKHISACVRTLMHPMRRWVDTACCTRRRHRYDSTLLSSTSTHSSFDGDTEDLSGCDLAGDDSEKTEAVTDDNSSKNSDKTDTAESEVRAHHTMSLQHSLEFDGESSHVDSSELVETQMSARRAPKTDGRTTTLDKHGAGQNASSTDIGINNGKTKPSRQRSDDELQDDCSHHHQHLPNNDHGGQDDQHGSHGKVASTSPSGSETILDWKIIAKVDWNIIFLLGGGFALSKGFQVCRHPIACLYAIHYISTSVHPHLALLCSSLHRAKCAIAISLPTITILT